MGRKIVIQNEIDRVKKKKLFLIMAFTLSMLLSIALVVTLYLIGVKEPNLSLISLVLLMGLIVFLLYIKPKMMGHNLYHKYLILLKKSNPPQKIKQKFDFKWIESIKKDGYSLFYQSDKYDIYIKISKILEQKIFTNNSMLEIINIIKVNEIDFYADEIHEQYKKIWIEHQAKHKINKQVILQLKKYTEYNEEVKTELDQVIVFSEKKNYLITINLGYFTNDSTLYYLHSDTYYPNLYYEHGCKVIKKLMY